MYAKVTSIEVCLQQIAGKWIAKNTFTIRS